MIVLGKVFSLVQLFCYLSNMLIGTKLAIQNKAQRFLAGRSQDLGAFKNKLVLAKFFHAFEKNLLLLLAYLPYVRVIQHFPLISKAHLT